MRSSVRRWAAVVLAAAFPHTGWCEEGSAVLRVGEAAAIKISSASDDDDYRDPAGYYPPAKPVHFFNRRLELINRSGETVRNVRLVINGNDLSTRERIIASATKAHGDPWPMLSVWRFWTSHRFHREVGTRAGADPVAALAGYGHTLCGEDSVNLAGLATFAKIPCRSVVLNGHAAYEYEMEGRWMFLDGDQSVYCLDWDNRTPVSAESIRKDPLLAIRTKVYGRSAPYNLAASWQNGALFERVGKTEGAPARGVSRKEYATVAAGWTLHPGERLEFEPSGTESVGKVALHFDPGARRNGEGHVVLELPLPLRGVSANGKPADFTAPEKWADGVTVQIPANATAGVALYQASRWTIPRLGAGGNKVELISDRRGSEGELILNWDCATESAPALPPRPVLNPETRTITAPGTPDRVWWQLAENGDFTRVHPNFDLISNSITYWISNSYDSTFLDNSDVYSLRAKVRSGGVWSDWSEAVDFKVSNPPLPGNLRTELGADGKSITFRWDALRPPVEAVICGSNRLDFVPEPLSEVALTRIVNGKVMSQEPNRNILGRTTEVQLTIPHTHRFYRILWGQGTEWTVSPLLRPTPPDGTSPGTVLQTRHRMMGKEDEYVSELMPLP